MSGTKDTMTFRLDSATAEDIRRFAHWTPGATQNAFVEEALQSHIKKVKADMPESFEPRPETESSS